MQLTLLHFGDLHGQLDRLPRLFSAATYLRHKTEAAGGVSLLVCTGDTVDRTIAAAAQTGGRVALPVLEAMGVQALVPGNHDADWGAAAFTRWVSAARFPILLGNIGPTPGTPWPGARASLLCDLPGLRVGLLGLSTPMLSHALGADAAFEPPPSAVAREAAALRADGAGTVIALSHLGYAYGPDVAHWMSPDEDTDVRLAEAGVDLDVLVGGHTHTMLTEPVRVGRTVIAHAGHNGEWLGELNLTLGGDGAVTGFSGRLHPIDTRCPIDPTISAVLELALEEAGRLVPGHR
ncbi:MAG TPA: metallophosphoesterase [Anaerolineales bacterium]|nr:metallophosphoesterase [Anaerolineales bacterium]